MGNIIIETTREGYAPNQINRTMTVGELIEALQEYDEDSKIFLGFDRGFGQTDLRQLPLFRKDRNGPFPVKRKRKTVEMQKIGNIAPVDLKRKHTGSLCLERESIGVFSAAFRRKNDRLTDFVREVDILIMKMNFTV